MDSGKCETMKSLGEKIETFEIKAKDKNGLLKMNVWLTENWMEVPKNNLGKSCGWRGKTIINLLSTLH